MEEKRKQQRDTKQRRLVYDDVKGRCDHPTVEEIYGEIHEVDDKVSRGTVYRNLDVLCENGQLQHVKVPGADRYDSRLDNHYHVICVKCGKVFDAPIEYLKENDEIVEKSTGFKIFRHRTVFEGICEDCLNDAGSDKENKDK